MNNDEIQKAQAILDADKQQRAEQCATEIAAILERLGCEIVAFVGIGGQNVPVPVHIVAH